MNFRQIALDAGADDAAVVGIDAPALGAEADEIRRRLPGTRSLLAYVVRMNRGPIRNPARSLANKEFHHGTEEIDAIGHRIVAALQQQGVEAVAPSAGFPMETSAWPGRMWLIQHKTVAEAAGLGRIGIHRNLIHPRFGNFILLGTVALPVAVASDAQPLDFNPCLECKLCVAACPVGAVKTDGAFDFGACYTHNYREFMGGFSDWVEGIAASSSATDYRRRTSDPETISWWQSLSFGPNYKAAYCMAVCPAGDEVIAPFRADRRQYLAEVVKPLQEKKETIYVIPGSDAEAHVRKRFPSKTTQRVGNGIRPQSVRGFLDSLPHFFQPGVAAGLEAVYHFRFSGGEQVEATVRLDGDGVQVSDGWHGKADLEVHADSRTWLGFLAKERNIVWALLRRKVRLRGPLKLLIRFGECFPL